MVFVRAGSIFSELVGGSCLTMSFSDRLMASARASSIDSSSMISSCIVSSASPAPGVADRLRHRSSSEALLKKVCKDLFFVSSLVSFFELLDFSGDGLGDDVADKDRFVAIPGSFLCCSDTVPLLFNGGFVAARVFAASERLRGRTLLGPGSLSSSESTTVDLR